MKRWTIYCHTHTETDRKYVGVTSQTMEKRWKNHIHAAMKSKGRWHFSNAIRKYGPEAFESKVIEVWDTLEKANEREKYWIKRLDTRNPEKGFNLAPGGNHAPHMIKNPWDDPGYRAKNLPISLINVQKATLVSQINKTQSKPEVKAVVSAAVKAAYADPAVRRKVSAANLGKTLSPEHRAKIAANDATRRPEVRAKLSAQSKAAWSDPDKRAKMSAANVRIASPQTRAKISDAARGRALPEQWRKSISEAMKGLPRKTRCRRGHPLEGAKVSPGDPKRRCLVCKRNSQRKRRAAARSDSVPRIHQAPFLPPRIHQAPFLPPPQNVPGNR
jgi:group I intron endonuclease